jgi:hypothetical protein
MAILAVVCLFIFNVTVRWPGATTAALAALVLGVLWIMMRDEDSPGRYHHHHDC